MLPSVLVMQQTTAHPAHQEIQAQTEAADQGMFQEQLRIQAHVAWHPGHYKLQKREHNRLRK